MYQNKKALLIGGGGTLGRYTAQELLDKGCQVDILCMNEPNMSHPNLQILRGKVDYAYLEAFLADKKYDGIVNFLHFEDIEAYKPLHKLLTDHTDQLIALSSYRVYNETGAPITEETPQLLHTSKDPEFLKDKTYYALVKSVLEDYIREESGTTNWTIVRPVISFSERRLDLVTRSGKRVVLAAQAGEPFELPLAAKDLIAGLDWSGNSGKLIANLLFKAHALGQAYTISSAFFSTVTTQVASLSPALAVIVALPSATAVTTPLLSTVATAALLLLHVTALSVALSGATVAVKVRLSPSVRVASA